MHLPATTIIELTSTMEASSSAPVYLNGMRCRAMSLKYSFASFEVDVPKPGAGKPRIYKQGYGM